VNTTDLAEIIQACKKGKRKAQGQLYEAFSGKMYAVCLYYSRNKDDAEDLLHNGFIKVFQKIDQFKGDGPFEAWIRRVFMNTALELFRKKNILYSINDEIEYHDFKEEADVISQLSTTEIIHLIQELTPAYQMVFNLYAIEGYTHKEIGNMMGIAEGTSKSNLARARAILQKKVIKQFKSSGRKLK
jgi:RNA polymerase sigma factor (sigma-70 family)